VKQLMRDPLQQAGAHALVNGEAVPFDALSVRSMNFGQPWRSPDVQEISYSLELPMAFFLALLEEQLPDLIADTRLHPDPADALDLALRSAGFPSAAEAMAIPALAQELARFFAHEALLRSLGDGGHRYVLNTIERVDVRPAGIGIEGKGCLNLHLRTARE
jgi:hypothetical protein